MKIAVLMYGHMRTYKANIEALHENLLSIYAPDLFIHTWDEIESRTPSWHERHMGNYKFSDADLREIQNLYKPVEFEVGRQVFSEDPVKTTPNNTISALGQKYMLESLRQANRLMQEHSRKSNIVYDVVIKIRPDIRLMAPLSIPRMEKNTVYIAGNKTAEGNSQDIHAYRACDILNIASQKDMHRICQIDEHFEEFYIDNFVLERSKHSGFVDYLLALDLRVVFLDYLYSRHWTIVRDQAK